jgi:hypothetical protein
MSIEVLRQPYDEHPIVHEIATARARVAATLIADPGLFPLDEISLRIAIAVNNLLFLLHPDTESVLVRRKQLALLAEQTLYSAALPTADDAREWLARHTLLHFLFEMSRDDVRVIFWAGQRNFRGKIPPARLLTWQKLRRVRAESTKVAVLDEAAADPHAQSIVTALVSASPLTALLHPARIAPPLDLRGVAPLLGRRELARIATARYLELGFGNVGQPFCDALFRLYEEPDFTKEARLATAFLCHLQLMFLLGRIERKTEELLAELRGTVSGRERQLSDFFGLFCAAEHLGAARPADLFRDVRVVAAVDRWVRACTELCGRRRIAELAALMSRGLGLPLAPPSP